MDVCTNMLVFSMISRVRPKFFSPDVRRDICVDVRGISGPKTHSLGCFSVPEFWGVKQGVPNGPQKGEFIAFFSPFTQQTRVYPYPLGAGSARPNPKIRAPDPDNPLFLGFSVLRGGLRPWSQTMVSEGARPWGRGRSGDCD